ncbi:MBL fold metallo-hydrolase [Thermophagus sp. OGC60D27]|uniref:MBL fold metallo-hydrolase n=1 Tax=Thermophagus sp. OGC60D27 TaxID=3458415 RepID=UPI00403779AA
MRKLLFWVLGCFLIMPVNAQEKKDCEPSGFMSAAERNDSKELFKGADFSVTIIGSGNPLYNPERSGPSALVQFNGTTFLVDMGNGTRSQLEKLALTRRYGPDALLITHHHLDHNEEFIPMVHQQLMAGKSFLITGPPPIRKMTDYVVEFYREDLEYRMSNKGQSFDANNMNAVLKELEGDHSFTYKGVQITTTEVPHSIYTLAYRFDANGKSIVISGDLTYSSNLPKLAKGADVLVLDCQVIRKRGNGAQTQSVSRTSAQQGNASRTFRRENLAAAKSRPGNSVHATIEEGARMAAEAEVKTLVITHLPNVEIDQAATKAKIAEQFKGEVIIAGDFLTVSVDGKVFMLK